MHLYGEVKYGKRLYQAQAVLPVACPLNQLKESVHPEEMSFGTGRHVDGNSGLQMYLNTKCIAVFITRASGNCNKLTAVDLSVGLIVLLSPTSIQ
jgi:hypothetical protein